jgi:Spy/CpxP family protein refolding chaperone
MKKLMIVCAVVGLLAASGAVWAAEGGGKGGPDHPRGGMKGGGHGPGGIGWLVHNEEAAKALGVTEDQLTQLREVSYQSEIQQIKTRADLEIAQLELRRLIASAKPTEEAVGKAVDKVSGLEAQLQKTRIGEMLKARAILGEEMMGKLRDAMREHMRERGMDRERGHRGDRRGVSQHEDRPTPPQAPTAPPEMDNDENE